MAAEFKAQSALPDLSRVYAPYGRSAAKEFLKLPDEPVRSITDRPAPLPIPIAAKEIMFKYKNPASLPADGLRPSITAGQCCKTHNKPYEATFVGEANVFFSDARCTAKVYAYDCAELDPKCQIPYKGDEHQLCVLTERTIVAEWLFYECFFHVSSSCVPLLMVVQHKHQRGTVDGFVATKNETYDVFGFAPDAKDSTDAKDAKDAKEHTRRFLGDDTFRNHFYSWYLRLRCSAVPNGFRIQDNARSSS